MFTLCVSIESVFSSAFVDASVHVDTPDAFVAAHAPYTLVLPVSVAEKVGVTPETGLLEASFRVMVTVEVATPFATTGLVPVIVELAAAAGPAVKVTVPPLCTTGVAMESVLTSAFVDASVHVDTPDAFVAAHAPYTLVLPVSVAEKVGVTPDTGLRKMSFSVMLTVEVATPFATTGLVPVMVELAAPPGAVLNVTVPPLFSTGVAIESVLISAFVDASVHVDAPDAFVAAHAPYTLVLPVSVAEKVGVTPETGLLEASCSVMVTVEVATPFATTGLVPVIVELAAAARPAE